MRCGFCNLIGISKHCNLIGAMMATIVAVTQVHILVIVARPLCFVLESGYARLVPLVIWEMGPLTSMHGRFK